MLTQKLKTVWNRAAKNGLIVHQFEVKKETWEFGLTSNKNQIKYFAKNLTKNKGIKAQILERKLVGTNFTIQLNEFRGLRPSNKPQSIGPQSAPSDKIQDCRFACQNKKNSLSLSTRPILEKIKLKNYTWNFYTNAFPYDTSCPFIIVPNIKNKLSLVPQIFNSKLLTDTLSLCEKSKGLIVLFQSLHAGASVNHFHLQAFFHNKKYALDAATIKNHILEDYPVPAFVYTIKKENDKIIKAINILQNEKLPFDLISANNKAYIFPRHPLHEIVSEFPHSPLGAMELMGKFVTSDKKIYQKFNIHDLYRSLNKTCLEI
jgi:hypothetical protein